MQLITKNNHNRKCQRRSDLRYVMRHLHAGPIYAIIGPNINGTATETVRM